ncbi:hypothetical protein DL237_07035 [Pseudooceanicola sediminis]|uniref:Uncharacterized protein n=1 Tax=Pseudooceanicola sediminis TaxID=2211117 RepID=A0A399J2D9_9RHOB|nr:hypothetical protein [Pseudooceanicola sediminis]KAA2314653.1 hypothetical protein E0K93_10100 [Puniceibacterium sp. HSS470]RII39391.1 hypothetical protein DL237_07035 [Pseudooceanicola sediminis]|tara:strand:- start:286 stop:624 length:339 start_codon:yes stop_codon:yes gene_type:complete
MRGKWHSADLNAILRHFLACMRLVFLLTWYLKVVGGMKSNLWMIDVLKDLQMAAQDRGLVAFAEQLQRARRVAHVEMSGQPDSTAASGHPPVARPTTVQDNTDDEPAPCKKL